MNDLSFTLPDSLVDAIVDRVTERVLTQLADHHPSPWLTVESAAAYLDWPIQRVYNHARQMPHHKHGARLMFRRDELDRWMEQHREHR